MTARRLGRDRDAAEQLARLLDGEAVEGAPEELTGLTSLATALREHTTVPAPHPAVKARIRAAVLEDVRTTELTWWERTRAAVLEHTARVRNSARVALASGLATMMVGTAGVAAAAQQALPGDALYGVKQLTESARMALAGGDVETGRLHLDLARERLEEITEGLGRLSEDELVAALEEMDRSAADGADHLLAAFERLGDDALLATLERFTAQQREALSEVFTDLPASVTPFAEQSLELLRRIDTQVSLAVDPCEACEEDAAAAARINGPDALPLPGTDPALPRRCDCPTARPEPAPPREGSSAPQPQDESTAPPSDEGEGTDGEDAPDDGDDPLEDITEDPAEDVDDAVDDLAEDPEGEIEDTTEDPEGEIEDLIDDTTGTSGGPVEDATSTLDDLLRLDDLLQ